MLQGRYEVIFNAEYGNATSNACSFANFRIDNVVQGTNFSVRNQLAGHSHSLSLIRDVTLTAGLHCFDVYYWNTAGTACMPYATIKIKKVH